MGKPTGFLEYARELPPPRPVEERLEDWAETQLGLPEPNLRLQGARCMDCGVPFCHASCPLKNFIPDWNDLVYQGRWQEAVRRLHSTNNFPEFTGRVCPAPCEAACVLALDQRPVTNREIEKTIVERAFREGWIQPHPPRLTTGKRVAIAGSGPAGLAAAQQLRRMGHDVCVFEKSERVGGLLRYGIPNFKLEKHLVDRRVAVLVAEGVRFTRTVDVGLDVRVEELQRDFDAVILAMGAEEPRDLQVPGRELRGVHFALEFLGQQNRRCEGAVIAPEREILATNKRVVIIGGGDTAADCAGTARRQHARSVHQLEIMPMPSPEWSPRITWPLASPQQRLESSNDEGGTCEWSVAPVRFEGDQNGGVRTVHAVRVGAPPRFAPSPGTEFSLPADLVLLAIGFLGPRRDGVVEQLGLALNERGAVATDGNYMTSVPGVFAAGDMHRGQSLVVWAIAEGRRAAAGVHQFLAQNGIA